MEHGKNLGARVDCQPEPEYLLMAAEPCSEFVEAAGVGGADVEMGAPVQGLRMLPCTSELSRDGRLSVAKDPLGCASAAFHLAPGTHRLWCRSCGRGGRGGETTSGAIVWAAGLEQTGK